MRFGSSHSLLRVLAVGLLAAGPLWPAAAPPAAADVVEPFGERYQASLYGDFTTVGNTVTGCPAAPADLAARCAAATAGEGADTNDTFVTRRLDTARTGGAYGSSTGRVRLPEGAEVAYARLSWGGNDGTYRATGGAELERCAPSGADVAPSPGDPATTAPLLAVGARAAAPVSIDSMVVDPADAHGPHYYTGESDVTAAFAGVTGADAPLAVGVSGVWAPNGKGCVAGWSLTVVHRFPGPDPAKAPERRSVHLLGGHVVQRPGSPATTVTVDGFRRAPGKARASVTAYEGDRSTPGDRFLVGGKEVTGSSAGTTDDFFAGEGDGAVSPDLVDNLSVDAKEVDVPDGAIPVGATSADLSFATDGDTYVPAALAFSVPVADLEVTRTATPELKKPAPAPTPTTPQPSQPTTPSEPSESATRTPQTAQTARTAAPTDPATEPTAGRTGPAYSTDPTDPADPPSPSSSALTVVAPPATGPGPHGGPRGGPGGSMAETGAHGERLWLLGALAVVLAGTGLVARAALRGRRG
ncbi:hypothetical protein ACF1E9_27725 [Streptomyces roseolus]|uniref:hypothetical protein n=1 Tax=Streptomyces roseolus TaxID=67358 RepID=UPI0036F95D19